MSTTPTPHPPLSSPPTMRVTVAVGYVRSCPRCRDIVAQLTAACIGDPTVQSCTAQPGREHACGALSEPKAPRTALAAATAQPAYVGEALPFSDTNGSDPEDVERVLFSTGPTAEKATSDDSSGPPGPLSSFRLHGGGGRALMPPMRPVQTVVGHSLAVASARLIRHQRQRQGRGGPSLLPPPSPALTLASARRAIDAFHTYRPVRRTHPVAPSGARA